MDRQLNGLYTKDNDDFLDTLSDDARKLADECSHLGVRFVCALLNHKNQVDAYLSLGVTNNRVQAQRKARTLMKNNSVKKLISQINKDILSDSVISREKLLSVYSGLVLGEGLLFEPENSSQEINIVKARLQAGKQLAELSNWLKMPDQTTEIVIKGKLPDWIEDKK